MTLGCWFRSGFSFLIPVAHAVGLTPDVAPASAEGLVPYPLIVIGTLLVGAAQPFFQCTPPLLSAQWFASDERATSTAVALNFNQIGIATAFLVGGALATSTAGLAKYFGLIAVVCTAVTVGTFLQFQDLPPTPPSTSELEKLLRGEKEPPFLESVKKFFSTPGFTKPLAAFVCSITVTNVVGVSER
jgi:FLVCR family feline leukemia virus subgroup C receptor-related protein